MKAKEKLCIVIASDIGFLGGLGIYQRNLLPFLKKYFDITYVYKGTENRDEKKDGVRYFQIKTPGITFLENLFFELKTYFFLKENRFDIINSHGFTGLWMNFFDKKNTRLVHTYHGSTYRFYKNHLKRLGIVKKFFFSLILVFPYLIERPPMKKADRIICNSDHVKSEMVALYGNREDIEVLRTGVDLKIFRKRDKNSARNILGLKKDLLYGLYIGRGGFWTKGLDKAIRLSRKIYDINKNYRLVVIGADEKKVRHLTNKDFVILLPEIQRKEIPFYYNAADLFFSMSRYEGGAPTMVTSEAMASGCIVVTDREANQEIIEDEKNGMIIGKDYGAESERIMNILNNKKNRDFMVKNSLNTIKKLSLKNWGGKYIRFLMS